MKKKQLEKIATYFGIGIVILLIIGVFLTISNKTKNIQLNNENKEEKSKLKKGLEIGLVILVIVLTILGLIIGFMKLFREGKKRYLRVEKELEDEYKLSYSDGAYYLRKKDLKK